MKKQNSKTLTSFLATLALGAMLSAQTYAAAVVTGKMNLWYPVTITWDGPAGDENAATFRNNRLNVTFTNGTTVFPNVPGYYAADGDAGQTGATAGNKWRVKFTPNKMGTWTYTAVFKTGTDIAASMDPAAGTDLPLVGATGTFTTTDMDPNATGFYKKGHLQYVGAAYPQFEGSKEWFVKGGPGSPENIFGYQEFDQTSDLGGSIAPPKNPSGLHLWPLHVADWKAGDPVWGGGTKGKGIIGAMNYLASRGVNTQYMIPMTYKGDGQDTWPWSSPTVKDIYDVSKLDQWDMVLTHMDAKGINKHYFMWENENSAYLGTGTTLSPERAIYDREIISRFSHCLGIMWDFSEEPSTSIPLTTVAIYVAHLHALDPYKHLTGTHCMANEMQIYDVNYGKPGFNAAFEQTHQLLTTVPHVVQGSKTAGSKMVVSVDEGPGTFDPGNPTKGRDAFWTVVMNGGIGHEAYFGYGTDGMRDCSDDNFRTRESLWDIYAVSLKFFFQPQINRILGNDIVANGTVLSKTKDPADAGFIAYPAPTTLNTAGSSGPLEVWWYNTLTGGEMVQTGVKTVTGGGTVTLGAPPAGTGPWVVAVFHRGEVTGIKSPVPGMGKGDLVAFSAPNGGLSVNYTLSEPSTIRIEVFSASGKMIKPLLENSSQAEGAHSLAIPKFNSTSENVWVRLNISSATGNKVLTSRVIR